MVKAYARKEPRVVPLQSYPLSKLFNEYLRLIFGSPRRGVADLMLSPRLRPFLLHAV